MDTLDNEGPASEGACGAGGRQTTDQAIRGLNIAQPLPKATDVFGLAYYIPGGMGQGVDLSKVPHDAEAVYWLPANSKNGRHSKADIVGSRWVMCDLDPPDDVWPEPRAGALDAWRAGALLKIEAHDPPFTLVVDSGRGYQFGYELNRQLPNDAIEALRYALAQAWGGDDCWDCSRLLRRPGSPNAKTGRFATLVRYSPEFLYAPETLPSEPPPNSGTAAVAVAADVVPVAGDVEEAVVALQDSHDVHPDASAAVLWGTDACDLDRWKRDRSAMLMFWLCECVRHGVPDGVILGLCLAGRDCLDGGFGHLHSTCDKATGQHTRRRYDERNARRQLANAHTKAKAAVRPPTVRQNGDQLAAMNARYAVVRKLGGKCLVAEMVEDPMLKRSFLSAQAFTDFRNAYLNKNVLIGTDKKGNPQYVPLGKWWLSHPERREFDRVVFMPGLDPPNECWNLWRGFGAEPAHGDRHQSFLHFVRDIICGGADANADDEIAEVNLKYDYLLNWMALAVQQPHLQGMTAVVLRSDAEGTGKGFFANRFGHLFGSHFLSVSNARHVTGNFNAHLRTCVLLFADEAYFGDKGERANALKSLITEPTIPVEGKGRDVEHSANCLHLIIATNEEMPTDTSATNRRYFHCDVSAAWKNRHDRFTTMRQQLDAGGYADLMGFLQARDVGNFNPVRDLPNTSEQQRQKDLSADDGWRDIIGPALDPYPDCKVSSRDLLALLAVPVERQDQRTLRRLARVMKQLGFERHKGIRFGGKPMSGYLRGKGTEEIHGGHLGGPPPTSVVSGAFGPGW